MRAIPGVPLVLIAAIAMSLTRSSAAPQPAAAASIPADVRLFRVWVANGLNNITLQRRP